MRRSQKVELTLEEKNQIWDEAAQYWESIPGKISDISKRERLEAINRLAKYSEDIRLGNKRRNNETPVEA